MIQLTTKLNLSGVQKFKERLPDHLSRAVRTVAFAVERDAKMTAPIDTGALRASIYTVTSDRTGYDAAAAAAAGKRSPEAVAAAVPQPQDRLTAIVAVGVNYGAHVEYGTHKMAAQPFLTPAATGNREFFADQVKAAVNAAAKEGGAK